MLWWYDFGKPKFFFEFLGIFFRTFFWKTRVFLQYLKNGCSDFAQIFYTDAPGHSAVVIRFWDSWNFFLIFRNLLFPGKNFRSSIALMSDLNIICCEQSLLNLLLTILLRPRPEHTQATASIPMPEHSNARAPYELLYLTWDAMNNWKVAFDFWWTG